MCRSDASRAAVATTLGLLLTLVACRAPDIPMPPPVDWLPAVAGETEAGVPAGRTLPIQLATILRLAGERPLELALARAQASTAAADEDVANSKWLPTLRPRATLLRHEGQLQNTEGVFKEVNDKQSAFAGAGVDMQLNLADAWFSSVAAAQRAHAARLGVRASQHIQVGEAVKLYYDLLQETASLQIAQQTVVQAREVVSVQEAGERAGRGLPADVLRAKAFLAASRGRVATAESLVMEITARLAGLLVLPVDTELVPTEGQVQPIDFKEADLPMSLLLERALGNRPEVQRARSLVSAADTDRDRETWSWLVPELHVGAEQGSFGFNRSHTHGREDYFADLQWRFSFGRLAMSRVADARLREEMLRMEVVVRDVQTDLQVAASQVRSAKARMAAASEEIAAAGAALELVRLRHKEGRLLLLEVLDAERSSTEASINLVRAICAQNRAQFELHRLLGGK